MTFTGQVINLPRGHIAGMPIEETLGFFGPALLMVVGAALTTLRARVRGVRRARGERASRAVRATRFASARDFAGDETSASARRSGTPAHALSLPRQHDPASSSR
jgi:hypothetical protein